MDPFADYERYDALGLAQLVQRGEVSAKELLEQALVQIDRLNPRLNAVVHRLEQRARQRLRGGVPRGPFGGVPYLLKDMVPYQGAPLTLGTALLKGARFVAPESHEVVRRSEAAGLVVLGITNVCELGLLPTTESVALGPAHNPWSLGHSPGGSSGGAAAAVAAGLVPLAHGNDGGGSIRIPASVCGLFGLKPSRGRNPGAPTDLQDGLTVEHCLARSVRDSAALLDATRGPRPGDRWWAPPPARPYREEVERDPPRLRIAFCTHDLTGRPVHPDCAAAVEHTARLCESLGHAVQQGAPQVDGERFNDAFLSLWLTLPSCVLAQMADEAARQPGGALLQRVLGPRRMVALAGRLLLRGRAPLERLTLEIARRGERVGAGELHRVWLELERAGRALARFLEPIDLWLTPVLGAPPLRLGELGRWGHGEALARKMLRYVAFTPICNTSGLPAMSVPLSWTEAGLPLGSHFVGRFGDEGTLFRLAGQLERAQPWFDRRPPAGSGTRRQRG